MSYILDALRKADQERNIGDVPDLDTSHWSQRRSGRVRLWVWLVAGLLLINAVFLAVLFNRDDGDDMAQTEMAANQPQLSENKPMAVTPQNTVVKPRQVELMPTDASSMVQRTPVASPVAPESVSLKPMSRPQRKPIANPRQPVVVKAAPEIKPANTIGGSVTQAERIPASVTFVQTDDPGIPEWNELSLEFRSGFNPPRLDVHVYDDEPSRRFILDNLKKYYEGDTLASGAKLEKIDRGSVQLYFQGTRFRYDR